MGDDFRAKNNSFKSFAKDTDNDKKEKGQSREYLYAYETLPAQVLNTHGESTFFHASLEQVWQSCNTPLKSGAQYMTEFCDEDTDRRGVAVNRWLLPLCSYLKKQQDPKTVEHNAYIMKEDILKELDDEIADILPSIEYILAPKKQSTVSGIPTCNTRIPWVDLRSFYPDFDRSQVPRIPLKMTSLIPCSIVI
jgi:hypothetical protein